MASCNAWRVYTVTGTHKALLLYFLSVSFVVSLRLIICTLITAASREVKCLFCYFSQISLRRATKLNTLLKRRHRVMYNDLLLIGLIVKLIDHCFNWIDRWKLAIWFYPTPNKIGCHIPFKSSTEGFFYRSCRKKQESMHYNNVLSPIVYQIYLKYFL